MTYILGHPTHISENDIKRIKADLKKPTPQALKKTLKKLKLQNKGTSYILSLVTNKTIPEVSYDTMLKAEWMFNQIKGKIPYYPDVIYDIFHKINPEHPILDWIPRRDQYVG